MYTQENLTSFEDLDFFEKVFYNLMIIAEKLFPAIDFKRFIISKIEADKILNLITLRGTRSVMVRRDKILDVDFVLSGDFNSYIDTFDKNDSQFEKRLITALGNHQIPLFLKKSMGTIYIISLDSGGYLGKQQWSVQLLNKLKTFQSNHGEFVNKIELIAPKQRKQTDAVSCPQYSKADILQTKKRDYFKYFSESFRSLAVEAEGGRSIPLAIMPPEQMLNAQSFKLINDYASKAECTFGPEAMESYMQAILRNSVNIYDKTKKEIKQVNISPRRDFFKDASFIIDILIQ